jgi:transposase-like protein
MASTSTRERDQLGARIAETPRDGHGHRRYDDALKHDVQQYAQQRIDEGRAQVAIATELGISGNTLWGWLYRASSRGTRRARALPERAKEFRAALAALGPRARTTTYPPELRALALEHVKERRGQDASMREIASELGVGADTLRQWQTGSRRQPRRAAVVRRVAIAPGATAPTSESIVVHGPAGMRVEGMDVKEIVALFKELAS